MLPRANRPQGVIVAGLAVVGLFSGGCRGPQPERAPASEPSHRDTWVRHVERPTTSGNVIVNGGFEADGNPWFLPDHINWTFPIDLTTAIARSGRRSLRGFLDAKAGESRQRKSGAVYTIGAGPMPRAVSLWYFVKEWEPGNAPQYILFSSVVSGARDNYQIRYFVTGVDTMPYKNGGNVAFVQVNKGAPAVGRWVSFTTDLHADFQRHWGHVPKNFESVTFGLMVRYDADRTKLERPTRAEVFFDDVFIGWGAPHGADGGGVP